MLKIALCDDSQNAICKYAEWIHDIARKHQIPIELSYFDSGESLMEQYSTAPQSVDIIYLDILMYETNGMTTAQKLRGCGCKAQIIFLTGYDDYMSQAFDVNAFHYLIKTATGTSKFEEVFLRAVDQASAKEEERFSFEFDGTTYFSPYSEIAYFEIWSKRVTVHYADGTTAKFYSSMEQLEQQVSGKDFARSHRSYLIHLPYIAGLKSSRSIVLKTGDVLPIGNTYASKVKEAFGAYMMRFHVYKTSSGQEAVL